MSTYLLHDWTLVKIHFDWRPARVTIELEDSTLTSRTLIAEGVRELNIPKANEWGPSISVNEVTENEASDNRGRCLQIEMQSGDVIRIVAEQVTLS